ncbi:DUF1343 domain-containing protein [Aquimarina sp. ERC-38]|uniref:exo-beta-N-acetylmuramidase NamZ family protein n=1 Tax=Aquimarina sp. ERC-38 TaxID=2949996 RepID=UPI0022481E68|nr:DUF1343 domain-containing protein [Aquimarina sp. ERC-38]UZO79384.1 DUF1343 domain-containing protein [Aquimarina sp. ERC-38]
MILFSILSKNTLLFFAVCLLYTSCHKTTTSKDSLSHKNTETPYQDTLSKQLPLLPPDQAPDDIIVAANQPEAYLPLLKNKKIAIVGNQTSVIFKKEIDGGLPFTHLVDSLLRLEVNIIKVFAPEHGFRGKQDAAEVVVDGKDAITGLPIISLYGKNKKPNIEMLQGIDLVVFDIQDVGVRFYTYISTLHYVMQACAENNIPVMVLDRPNPNIHYVDGPVLEPEHSSFIGMHPVPLVYGMTIGEYAQMINGENWLTLDAKCDLTVIPLKNYDRKKSYHLPIRPSPNLPNDQSIMLYPSLGLFEGTTMNAGRGTEMQFQIFGSPYLLKEKYTYTYTPQPNFGSKSPKYKNQLCYGMDLRSVQPLNKVNLQWLFDAYQNTTNKKDFFKTASFTLHAGNTSLQKAIENNTPLSEVEALWKPDLEAFLKVRERYLLY